MQNTATIAVIIPYYNGSAFIERAVESVRKQTVQANEFVVVNDGSTTAEAEFVHALGGKLSFKVIDKINGGQGSARNAGVSATTSDFICFLDQDDFFLPEHNEVLKNAIPVADDRFGWVYADLYRADVLGSVYAKEIVKRYGEHPKTSLHQVLGTNMMILPSASLISRKSFEDVGGFDEQFMGYEDDDLFIRMFLAGYTNHFLPDHVTTWCMHSDSTVNSVKMSRSRMKFFKKWFHAFPDDPSILRDCLVPRFHADFIGDAMTARVHDNAEKAGIYAYKSELNAILNEYAKIVFNSPSVSMRMKLRLRMQLAILSLDSRFAANATRGAMNVLRSLRSR